MKPEIVIREAHINDMPFIYNSWLISYGSSSGLHISKDLYFREQQRLIEKLVGNPQVECLVACLPEYENQILGWVCRDRSIIHYMYVKHPYRKLGIGRTMLNVLGSVKFLTHHTRISTVICPKWKITYNPYLLMEI